ncbi:MAG: RNA-binding protein [Oscillospiraceae bacterium]|nr:RNA-binding protein [Oscillospiraceae bacterium]
MEHDDLLKRVDDLARRCERANIVTSTPFLTPADQAAVVSYVNRLRGCRMRLSGGQTDCERKAAFFLPDWMEEGDFDPAGYIAALRIDAYYGVPGHRDYLGALLGLGVRREWIGDIRVEEQTAWVFCLPSVAEQLAGLEQAGRVSVKAAVVPLGQVPEPERKRKEVRFTVQSLRLDAVLGETFRLSRTQAVKLIALGAASLNYLPCLKNDAPVKEGDVISLKGHGKATVTEIGGQSRKGRLFVVAELWV